MEKPMSQTNKQVLLAARPVGIPKESDFELVEKAVPTLADGQFLVRILWLSVDPYMRGRMRDAASYAAPLQIGDVMIGGAVGEIVESRHPDYAAGDFVEGMFGWQQYAVSEGEGGVRKLDPDLAPLPTALYALGMPGLTAYFGLLDVGQLKEGDTVVVSGAAGAVGALVGQIAKIKGCRVIGIAGSDEKVEYVTTGLGFDAAFNYRSTKDYSGRLAELCPNGIDVYFDNVGGRITDGALLNLAVGARVVICGQISQYNLTRPELGPRLLFQLIIKQARIEGFLVFQFAGRYREGLEQMAAWLREGRIRYREQIAEGIENAPAAFIGMLQGANIGKQLVKVSG
jgi:NADPH-dependent curcumin reductase CurA